MIRLLPLLTLIAFLSAPAFATTTPGLQVVDCFEDPPGSGNWIYSFFVCSGDFQANDLHLELTAAEIAEGTVVTCCAVPNLAGFSCQFDATGADYFFPLTGPWGCVPGISGEYLTICVTTADQSTIVTETWTLDGDPVASFTTLIACPPTGTEMSTWGRVKTLFQ